MIDIQPRRIFLGFATIFRHLSPASRTRNLPVLDEEEMPEWQKRDLGFRDGRFSMWDDFLRR